MSSGALDPINNPQEWDVIRVGGITSPGLCKLGDMKSKSEWDVKKGKGVYGATLTYVGRPPTKFTITFKLWLPSHFAAWDTFRPLFKYDATKKQVQAVDIYHPALADIELSSVVCEGIGAINHEGNQLYTIAVDFIEYFPAPKGSAISTPTGSKSNGAAPGASGAQADPVADAQQKQIAALLAQASAP